MKTKLKILVSPLNWGLGHATRSIAIIKELLELGHDVTIAGNGQSFVFLQRFYPELNAFEIPGVNVKYGKKRSFSLSFLLRFPTLAFSIFQEYNALKKILRNNDFDVLISDNRPGFFSKNIYSIYITHQINIFLPNRLYLFNRLMTKIHHFLISRFDECWIPDIDIQKNFTGKLSCSESLKNVKRIGILSRFDFSNITKFVKQYDYLILLSGPEPQRTILERILINKFSNSNLKTAFLRGLPQGESPKNTDNIVFFNHADDEKFLELCNCSKYIIARSGYSTIMDLLKIGKSAFLIPTPGQTEQEYLAERMSKIFAFISYSQNEIENIDFENLHYNKVEMKYSINKNNIVQDEINRIHACLNNIN